jgi:hypothetical protein
MSAAKTPKTGGWMMKTLAYARQNFQVIQAVTALAIFTAHSVATAADDTVVNAFDKNREGWQVYDYNGGAGAENKFFPASWERAGGFADSGYIWADDSRWRIDTPETPHSILALILYRSWVGSEALNLRDATLSVCLRGDELNLHGAQCYFWVLDQEKGTRWHCKGQPLTIGVGRWEEPQRIVLTPDEKLWYRSWTRNVDNAASLKETLGSCDSYGFSFVGFEEEVTGRLSMDELKFELSR